MGCTLRTRWDLLKPDLRDRVVQQQAKQKEQHDQHTQLRLFSEGQDVMARNFGTGATWTPEAIAWQLGPVNYLVDVYDFGNIM